MEPKTGHILDADPLLRVRLRLDGLATRLARLDRDLEKTLGAVPEDLRKSIEFAHLHMGLRGVELGFSGAVKAICLALDGTLPDEGDWYEGALAQLARTGRGRAPALPSGLIPLLLEVREAFPDVPVIDEDERLRALHARRDAAREAYPLLVDAVRSLDGPTNPAPPDPDLLAAEPGRLARAATRKAAMGRAAAAISEAFADRGRRAVPFGSVLDGPVHGRSDLDLVVPGEMAREERNALWDLAERIAAEEGVEIDLHFEHMYRDGFLDELRTIRDGRVVTLRELVEAGDGPGETPEP
jgi:predicted nucleotidyltransferase